LTLIHERADFDEVMSDFGGFEIDVYEFTYAGGVDDITAGRKRVHFGEGGGVFSLRCCREISPVFSFNPGSRALIKLDFPTPECRPGDLL
jgi:hypothetical protein